MDKKTLQQYVYIENKIHSLEEQKETIRKNVLSVRVMDGMPRTNKTSDTVGNMICKIDRIEQKINEKIDELILLREAILLFIVDLPSPYYEIMYKRYIEGKSCKVVAAEMGYSEEWFYRKQSEIFD